MHTDSFNHNDVDIHKMNIKANFIGALGSSLFVLAIFGCLLLTAVVLIVGITHWSLLVVACTAFFCGSLIFFGIKGFMVLIREGATTYATVVHAAFEHKRSSAIYLADPNRVIIHEDAPVHIEAVRQIQETHHFTEDEMLLPEQAESRILAPPFRQLLPTIERVARQNDRLPLREKKWYIGHGMDGKPIIGTFYDVRACGFGGAQGQGKTSNMVNFAYQGHAYGFGLVIFDPHMHNEEGLVPRLASIRNSFTRPPVGEDGEAIFHQFEWLQAQYEQRKRPGGMKNARTLMVFADEWNELLRALRGDPEQRKQVINIMLNLIQGGRKHGIFPFVAAQNWQNETVGGSDLRYALPTRISHRNETPAMKMLLNCTERQLEDLCTPPLQTMDAIISTANGQLYRYCIPRPELEDGAACDEIRLRVANGFPQVAMNRPTYAVSDISEDEEVATLFSTAEPLPNEDSGYARNILSFPGENHENRLYRPQEVAAVGSSAGIAETEIKKVIELQMRGYTNTRIMQELWDTPKGGHQYQRDIERLRRIQTIIAQRAVSNG